MKHVTFGDKSLLVGDAEADALLEYARMLADADRADTVTLSAISTDGNTVEASFLLHANSSFMTESTNSDVKPPDNAAVILDIRERIAAMSRPARAEIGAPWATSELDDTGAY